MTLLGKDDFALFSIDPLFRIDTDALTQAFLKLQAVTHPDRFVRAADAEKRAALQMAMRVNEAYRRLKNPLTRAAYLCELHGASIHAETNTQMPADFLMEQLQWRESLDDAQSLQEIDDLRDLVTDRKAALFESVAELIDDAHDYSGAAQLVRQLMFVEKFMESIPA